MTIGTPTSRRYSLGGGGGGDPVLAAAAADATTDVRTGYLRSVFFTIDIRY
jgi:hypothetical protein